MEFEILLMRISELCLEKGLSPTAAYKNSGVGKDFALNIKAGFSPSTKKLMLLADFFDVSTDYLLGKTDIKKEPSPELEEKARALGQYLLDKGIVPDLSDESLSVVMDILNANTDIIRKILNNEK